MKKFTLLELLIVVAVIGILITLLLPSLENARKEAESTVCKTNLNTQFTAISRYVVDNTGWLPNYQDYDSGGSVINGTKWKSKLWVYV